MITYRALNLDECKNIASIDCSEWIENAWRNIGGELKLIPLKWNETGWSDGIETYISELEATIKENGVVFGAFHEKDGLIGVSSINHSFFGKTAKYLLLDSMFVSRPYRGQGVGKQLMILCCKQALVWKADKVYLCAASSEHTINFYKSMGCTMAKEVNQELYSQDERDVQMELDLALVKF